jgi:hypothetical protein
MKNSFLWDIKPFNSVALVRNRTILANWADFHWTIQVLYPARQDFQSQQPWAADHAKLSGQTYEMHASLNGSLPKNETEKIFRN